MYIYNNLAEFLTEWEMFQTKVTEEIKTSSVRSADFIRKSRRVWDNVEKVW